MPFTSEAFENALERAARAVHENEHGKGSWTDAPTPIRSNRRHQVRLMLSTLAKNGYILQEEGGAAIAVAAPPKSQDSRIRRAAAKPH